MGKVCVGVDVGGTTVKLGLFEVDGQLMDKWEIPTRTEDGAKHILPDIAESVKAKLAEKDIDLSEVVGAGMGIPGPVLANGMVTQCVNLGWKEKNAQKELSELLGVPVKSGNDANVAANHCRKTWSGR